MSILVYTETDNGKFKKNAYEAVSYAYKIAETTGDKVVAIAVGAEDASQLYKYGAAEVLNVSGADAHKVSPEKMAELISSKADGNLVVMAHSNESASIAPFVAHKWDAALITNVLDVPSSTAPVVVNRKAFSGKGIMEAKSQSDKTVLTISLNSYGVHENPQEGSVQDVSAELGDGKLKVENVEQKSGTLDLKEAEIVVSAGRGMKGPENWGMVEELAGLLGAATACSKPVSDMDWRPHSEHVGQTGKAIAPNLYIALGISGAIQHLAGVNASKNIVVINSDPDAPFFKSADYGIVGDVFEVLPKLIDAVKAHKG